MTAEDQLRFDIELQIAQEESKKNITAAMKQLEAYYKTRPIKIPLTIGAGGADDPLSKIAPKIKNAELAAVKLAQQQDRINNALKLENTSRGNINQKVAALRKQQQMLVGQGVGVDSAAYKKLQVQIDRLSASYVKLANTTNTSTQAMRTQAGVMNGMKQFANAYISALGAFSLIKNIKDITAEFELQKVSLGAITQDLVFTDNIWEKIKASAVESPFAVKELVTFTKQISAYGIANKDLFDTMGTLSDISAGLGVEMSRLILAYGQVSAATVLRGCLGKGTEVQLLNGESKFVEAIIPTDILLGDDGTGRNISELIRGREQMYKICSLDSKAKDYRVNEYHILTLFDKVENEIIDIYVLDYLKDVNRYLGVIRNDDGDGFGYYKIRVEKDIVDDYFGFVIDGNKRFIIERNCLTHNTELRQFTEAGIPLVQLLADKYSALNDKLVTTGQVFDMISNRQVAFGDVKDIFEDLTSEGGRFFEMQKLQAESLKGIYNNLTDAIQISFDEIGRSNRGVLVLVGQTARFFAENLKLISDIGGVMLGAWITAKVVGYARLKLLALEAAAETKLAFIQKARIGLQTKLTFSSRLYTIASLKAAAATGIWTKAMWSLTAAILKNPFVIAAAAILVAVTAYTRYVNKLGDVEGAINRVQAAVKVSNDSFKGQNKAIVEAEKALEKYNALARTTPENFNDMSQIYKDEFKEVKNLNDLEEVRKKSLKETEEAIKSLAKAYPHLFTEEVKQLGLLEQLTAIRRAHNNELSTAELDTLNKQREEAEDEVERLQKNIEDIAKAQAQSPEWIVNLFSKVDEARLKNYTTELNTAQSLIKSIDSDLKSHNDSLNETVRLSKGWEKALSDLRSANDAPLFIKTELSELTSFDQMAKTVAEKWKAVTDEIKLNTESITGLESLKGQNKANEEQLYTLAQLVTNNKELVSIEEELVRFAKDYYITLSNTEEGRKTAIELWKAELDNIRAAEKAYEDLNKVMGSEQAEKKVESVFGITLDEANFIAKYEKLIKEAQALGLTKEALALDVDIKQDALEKVEKALKVSLAKMKKDLSDFKVGSDFFDKIFGKTGDAELSKALTLSITGIDITGQNLQEELAKQLSFLLKNTTIPLDVSVEPNVILSGELPIATIQKQINKLIEEGLTSEASNLQASLDAYVNYNKSVAESLFDALDKYGSFEEKRSAITKKMESDTAIAKDFFAAASKGIADPASLRELEIQLQRVTKAITTGAFKDNSALNMEEILAKNSVLLAEMDKQTSKSLAIVKQEFIDLAADGTLTVDELTDVMKILEQIRDVELKNPFVALIDAVAEFTSTWSGVKDGEKDFEKISNASTNLQGALGVLQSTFSGLLGIIRDVTESLGGAFPPEMEDIIKGIGIAMSVAGVGLALIAVAGVTAAAGVTTLAAAFAGLMVVLWPLLVIALAIGAAFAIFSIIANKDVRAANREIEKQAVALDELELAYKRLENAMKSALGTDQLKLLQQETELQKQELEAIQKQLAAEQSKKGKKQDSAAIQGYKEAIIDLQHEIDTAGIKMQEALTGTNVTSAAEDFAKAWLDAYIDFGNTTEAIQGKFKEMINNMIVSQGLSTIAQTMLEPFFKQMEQIASDGKVTTDEIAGAVALISKISPELEAAFQAYMDALKEAGVEVREGESNLTGISKEVGTLSEDSALTMAAALTSNNYLTSSIDKNVLGIYNLLSTRAGGTTIATDPLALTLPAMQLMSETQVFELRAISVNTLRSANGIDGINERLDKIISVRGSKKAHVVNTAL